MSIVKYAELPIVPMNKCEHMFRLASRSHHLTVSAFRVGRYKKRSTETAKEMAQILVTGNRRSNGIYTVVGGKWKGSLLVADLVRHDDDKKSLKGVCSVDKHGLRLQLNE